MENCRGETLGIQFRNVNSFDIYILPQNAGNACSDVIHSTYVRMVRPIVQWPTRTREPYWSCRFDVPITSSCYITRRRVIWTPSAEWHDNWATSTWHGWFEVSWGIIPWSSTARQQDSSKTERWDHRISGFQHAGQTHLAKPSFVEWARVKSGV